ncbi:MAG: hypothetical protein ACWIPJ_07520 [Polaribacter sp.]
MYYFIQIILIRVVVEKGKLFWFFSVGFVCWQKPNVLDHAVDFSVMVGNAFVYGLLRELSN